MAQISVNELTFYYDGSYDNIFENVTFKIDSDWKLGFVGRNGRGKTTFLNLLQGKYEYRGSMQSDIKFDYFPPAISKKQEDRQSVVVLETLDPDCEIWRINRELNLLQVDADILYRPYSTLSNGEQTKLLLALLFSKKNNFLLIDEPTNHLDIEARELLCNYLNQKKGFILVSHDRWFLDQCIDHILVINKQNIEVRQENFGSWWENKQRQDAYEISENEKLKKGIKKLTESARQKALWADKVENSKIGFNPLKEERNISTRAYIGEKSRRMQQRRKNLERRQESAIKEKEELLKNIEVADTLKMVAMTHHKEVLVRAENLSINYGERQVVCGLNMELRNGDRVNLRGRNGCGKSSIIKVILAQTGQANDNGFSSNGIVEIASGLKVSYISQDTSFLRGSLEEFIYTNSIDETLFKAILRKLDFERTQFTKQMENYSGGQKKKVLIAKSLCEQAHLYIWDEPLNYIDIFSRMQIEALIKEFAPTLLFVEHDKSFVNEIATKIIDCDLLARKCYC